VDELPLAEALPLLSIVAGVYLVSADSPSSSTSTSTFAVLSTLLVLLSNLCFSLRATHQTKLQNSIRAKKEQQMDALTLLFRFSYFALYLTAPLFLFAEIMTFEESTPRIHAPSSSPLHPFLALAPLLLLNGVSFTLYNLASTAILTRVSPIEHAAMNGVRPPPDARPAHPLTFSLSLRSRTGA
jgi:hypothetical protein